MVHSRLLQTFVLLTLLAPLAAPGQVIGFTVNDDRVTELLLSQPGETVEEGESWTISGVNPMRALEFDIDGSLLTLHSSALSSDIVSRLDLESGTATAVVSLSVGQMGLAVEPSGRLWIARYDGELRSYDPVLDELSPRVMIDSGASTIGGIAWLDGKLYALFSGEQLEDGPSLGVVDTNTGAVSELRELTALRPEPSIQRFVTSLDFDDAGGLWIGLVDTFAIADPPIPMPAVAHLSSASSTTANIRWFEDGLRFSVPLAVTGSLAIVAVPTLGGLATSLLALLLLAVGLTTLRRN